MLLKRQYQADGVTLASLRVLHTGTTPQQRFSTRLVKRALTEGWMALGADRLVLLTRPESLLYTVVALPQAQQPYYECVLDADQHARYQYPGPLAHRE